MSYFEFQINTPLIQKSVDTVLRTYWGSQSVVVARPANLQVSPNDPLSLIPVGGKAELTFASKMRPIAQAFRRTPVSFVPVINGVPGAPSAPQTELTSIEEDLLVKVQIFGADGKPVQGFEVGGTLSANLIAEHTNIWKELPPEQWPTGTTLPIYDFHGARARICIAAPTFTPSTSDGPTTALAATQTNAILAGAHLVTIFPAGATTPAAAAPTAEEVKNDLDLPAFMRRERRLFQ